MIRHNSYAFTPYQYFDYVKLSKITYIFKTGRAREKVTYNDCIIMADTETSKETAGTICKNYVVAWTISVRAFDMNIVTLYGHRPSEMVDCLNKMMAAMEGMKTVVYIHNLNYDWTFLRKHFIKEWGAPEHQLNTKSYNPIYIEFKNGLILRDSLILSQRSLEKWAKDLDVDHQKAVGAWDYDKVRNQSDSFSPMEKTYIENDTLAGVECIQKTMDALGKRIFSMPYTATGIERNTVQQIGKKHRAKDLFKRIIPPYNVQQILEKCFHGGYVHLNRYYAEKVVRGDIDVYDAISGYPAWLLLGRYPMERFSPFNEMCDPHFILANSDVYAYIFKLIMIKPELKEYDTDMPVIQSSKCERTINEIDDCGRILEAEYLEIYTNSVDLELIMKQYKYKKAVCIDVFFAELGYLPKWFTDHVFELFAKKQKLRGGDPVAYSIAKSRLNSLFGMSVQKPCKVSILENYENGEFEPVEDSNEEALYEAYRHKYSAVLPFQWGSFVTSYMQRELHKIGEMVRIWIYSDTDSVVGKEFDLEKLYAYNEDIKRQLVERGYGGVTVKGVEYWPGTFQLDGQYSEFIAVGAKRYACREKNGNVKITCAGLSKAGVKCLEDDLWNFHAGFVFDGNISGKKKHTYFIEDDIWIDENGNERGDSIDLSPDDYTLDSDRLIDEDSVMQEEIEVQVYEED